MKKYTILGDLITPAKVVRCGKGNYPVLSMTMHDGIVLQSDRFKKSLASADQSDYKVVEYGKLVIGFPIDEGVLYIQKVAPEGIMSPAYSTWDVDTTRINPDFLELCLHSPQSMQYYRISCAAQLPVDVVFRQLTYWRFEFAPPPWNHNLKPLQ